MNEFIIEKGKVFTSESITALLLSHGTCEEAYLQREGCQPVASHPLATLFPLHTFICLPIHTPHTVRSQEVACPIFPVRAHR